MCFFDLKYKEDAFIFMLFYFVFVMYGKIRNCLKGVYIRKKTPKCIHWLFICVLCCYIHWIYFNLLMHKFYFWDLHYVMFVQIFFFFFNFYRLF